MSTPTQPLRHRARRAAASLALIIAACGGVEPPSEAPLEIGSGLEDGTPGFLPLVDGQDLTLVPGAQGGFHVFLNVRVAGDAMEHLSERPLLEREARRVSTGELVSKSKHRTPLVPVDDAASAFESERSIPLFLCPTPIGIPVADQEIRLEVEANDESSEGAEPMKGTIRFVPRCPEGDQKAFCERSCYG